MIVTDVLDWLFNKYEEMLEKNFVSKRYTSLASQIFSEEQLEGYIVNIFYTR